MKRWDRLLALVPHGTAAIADIGTDHGYLAINALKRNHAKTVYATDIAMQPLIQARTNLKRHHLLNSPHIKLIKSNGLEFLQNFPEATIDYAIIAGLGTTTIHEIIREPHQQVKNYLILSNTEISRLRHWAQLHNLRIEHEDFFYERNRPYWLILINTTRDFIPITNFNFGDWKRWYQSNDAYRDYLQKLREQHLRYQHRITDSHLRERNEDYIKEIESYLQQWNY